MVNHETIGDGSTFSFTCFRSPPLPFYSLLFNPKIKSNMKSKTTATVLCFFLGSIGVHRFYLGQSGLGFLYLIFSWTFVPAVIAVIDFIVLLLMSEESFNQKYNLTSIIMRAQTPSNNNVNTVAINMGTPANNSDSSVSEEIKKLYELKEKGIITQEEFDLKKKTIL